MSKPGVPVVAQPSNDASDASSPGEVLLRTFNSLRDDLVSTLWFMLGNQEDAQDVAQEAFLRCWRTLDSQPDIANLRAWIFRVGLNAAKDLQRSAWRRRVKSMQEPDVLPLVDETPPGQDIEHQESMQRVRKALMQLRPEEQEVFLLRENGDLTYEQIAEMRNRPVGTVKTQMRSALAKLRQALS
jgi:RNA polymerase sigma-70 factor, ECF subfamily